MNEVRFKIGGDTSSLSRAFVQAQSVAASAGKAIERKLSMKDAFKSSVLAFGLSIENLSTKVAELFSGGAQESWKDALRSAMEAARIIEESTLARMSTTRQIAEIEKQIRNNLGEEDRTPRAATELRGLLRFLQPLMGKETLKANLAAQGETPADANARADAAAAKRRADEARVESLQEKKRRDEDRIAAARADLARVDMDDMQKAVALQDEMLAAYDKVAEAIVKGKEATELHLVALAKQKALAEALREIGQKQTDNDRKVSEERRRAAEAAVRQAEQNLEAAERIQEIEADAAAQGETTGERILRLRREAADLERRAADTNRSEDSMNRLRVDAAEKRAAAAKEEYDWRVKAASIHDSEKTPGGRNNTTQQGVLANRAARAAAAARRARAEGRFGEARRQGEIARGAEEQFAQNDRAGMTGSGAPPMSDWDRKYGAQLAARNNAITSGVAARNAALRGDGVPQSSAGSAGSPELVALQAAQKHLAEIEKSLKPASAK